MKLEGFGWHPAEPRKCNVILVTSGIVILGLHPKWYSNSQVVSSERSRPETVLCCLGITLWLAQGHLKKVPSANHHETIPPAFAGRILHCLMLQNSCSDICDINGSICERRVDYIPSVSTPPAQKVGSLEWHRPIISFESLMSKMSIFASSEL